MAKRYNEYDLRVEKSSAIKRTVAICVAMFLLLLGVLTLLTGCASRDENGNFFAESDIAKWFNYWGKGAPQIDAPTVPDMTYDDPEVEYGKYGFLVVSTETEEGSPVALSATTRQVNGSVAEVITATVTPIDADIFGVLWESADSASVVVTPIEGDMLSARLTCISPFSIPVTITCTVISLENLTATCKVDCLMQPGESVIAGLYDEEGNSVHNVGQIGFGCTYNTFAHGEGMWFGSGTVSGELRVSYINIYLTDSFVQEMSELLPKFTAYYCDYDASGESITLLDTPNACFGNSYYDDEEFRAAFAQACYKLGNNCATVSIEASYVYEDKVYARYTYTFNVGFDGTTFVKAADDLTVSPDNPVFGT